MSAELPDDSMTWENLLSPLRTRNLLSGGTPTSSNDESSTKADGDARSEFQRDYDRALFSTPVRRLQDKAQVFPLEPNDSVRTRLTHSLEVSNVAQSIARRIAQWLEDEQEVPHESAQSIIPIAATCGLIHDLGNPPFGHAGEYAMRVWFERKLLDDLPGDSEGCLRDELSSCKEDFNLAKDFELFEGNAQTVRLISKLQMLGDFDGLNLTSGTVSAALKYTADSNSTVDDRPHERTKPGYFFSEQKLVKRVQIETGTGQSRNPITYIVEASDDIVYSVVDLEDGIKKGALTWRQLKDRFTEGLCSIIKDERKREQASDDFDGLRDKVENNLSDRIERAGIEGKLSQQDRDEGHAQLFRTMAIGIHVEAAIEEYKRQYSDIMRGTYSGELMKTSATSAFLKACKGIAARDVFGSSGILQLELMGKRVISDLMDIFWEGARLAPGDLSKKGFDKKAYELLSENYRLVFEHEVKQDLNLEPKLPIVYRRLQLVADYICGMTDSFACSLHSKLTNG